MKTNLDNNHTPADEPKTVRTSAGIDNHKPYSAKRCTFWKTQGESVPCFFCKTPTLYILIYRNGSEDWACKSCLYSRGKIKRFKANHIKPLDSPKHTKLCKIPCVKNAELGVFE